MEQWQINANSAVRAQNKIAKDNASNITQKAVDAIDFAIVSAKAIINDAHESLASGLPLSLSDDHLKLSRAINVLEKEFVQQELPHKEPVAPKPVARKRGRPRKNAKSN